MLLGTTLLWIRMLKSVIMACAPLHQACSAPSFMLLFTGTPRLMNALKNMVQTSRTYCQLSTSAGQPVTVSATSATFTTSQTCALTVSFPGFSSPVPTATAQVTVVVMKSLVIRPQHYNHTFAEGDLRTVAPVPDSRYTTLQQIKCNGSDYEQVSDSCHVPALHR